MPAAGIEGNAAAFIFFITANGEQRNINGIPVAIA
jgi:hypothetical protein